MTALPTVPSFATGDTNLTTLQQLSYAVSFLSDTSVRPAFHIYKNSSYTVTPLSTWQTPSGGTRAYDGDGIFSGGGSFTATIQTQGYYAFEGCMPFLTSALMHTKISFLLTGGGNNPNLGTGSTIRFGMRDTNTNSQANQDSTLCCADQSPIGLYLNDTVAFQVWSDTAVSTGFNNNGSYITGRFVPNFTGYWLRTAP